MDSRQNCDNANENSTNMKITQALNFANCNAVHMKDEKHVRHATSDDQVVAQVEQIFNDQNLVGNFGPTQDSHKWPLRRSQDLCEASA